MSRFVIVLTVLVALGPLSTDLYLPSLPLMVEVFDTDISLVQLTLSVFLLSFGWAQLLYGSLSDRFGRRPVLLVGLVIYVVSSLGCVLAQSVEQLIVLRFFQAVGACSGVVMGRTIVRDVYSRRRAAQIFSYMAMAMSLAPAVGPIVGGVLVTFGGWRACFLLLLMLGVVTTVQVFLSLSETNRNPDPTATRLASLIQNYTTLLGHREFIGYTLCAACIFSGIFTFISGSSFVLIEYFRLTPIEYGFCFSFFVLGYMVGSFLSATYVTRWGIARLVYYGLLVASISGVIGLVLVLFGVLHVLAVVVPTSLFMIGAGLVLPNAQMGGIMPFPTMAGAASALLGCLQMSIAGVVGMVVGVLTKDGPLPMMGILFLVCIFGVVCFRTFLYRKKT